MQINIIFSLAEKKKLRANTSVYTITNSDKEKMLGVPMDNHPKFTTHATAICNKESQISQLFLEYCHM